MVCRPDDSAWAEIDRLRDDLDSFRGQIRTLEWRIACLEARMEVEEFAPQHVARRPTRIGAERFGRPHLGGNAPARGA